MKKTKNNNVIKVQTNKGISLSAKLLFSLSFSICFLFLLNFSSASEFGYNIVDESIGEYNQGENIRITQVCDDATYVNITSISYPNSSIAVSDIEMISSVPGEFYYDFNITIDLGRYDVRGISDGCEKTFTTYFKITKIGSLAILIILIFLGSASFITYLYNKDEYYLTIISGISFLFSGILSFGTLEPLSNALISQTFGLILMGLGLISLTESIWRFFPNG